MLENCNFRYTGLSSKIEQKLIDFKQRRNSRKMKTGKKIWKANKVLLCILHAKYDNNVTNKLLG